MLEVRTRKSGDLAVLCLQGQIVRSETEILRNAAQSVTDVSALILDFARVTTVDAGGLGVLLELRAQAAARGIRFELMNVTKLVRMVLEITCLDSVFQITSGVEFFPAVSRRQQDAVALYASCA